MPSIILSPSLSPLVISTLLLSPFSKLFISVVIFKFYNFHLVLFYDFYLLFFCWDFLFFTCFKGICNWLQKHFYDSCFEILVRSFQHLIHLSVGIHWLFFLVQVVIFWFWLWWVVFEFNLDIWFIMSGHFENYLIL